MLCNFPKATESAGGTARTKTCRYTDFWAKELFFRYSKLPPRCEVTFLSKWKLVLKRQELIYCLVQTGKYID